MILKVPLDKIVKVPSEKNNFMIIDRYHWVSEQFEQIYIK